MMKYSVVGLGKLGCSVAAAVASRGAEVIGYDVVPETVDLLSAGIAPVAETGLQELISEHRPRLRATHSLAEAVHESDLTFVVVPTPSDSRGAFILSYAVDAFAAIGTALATKREPHTVVLTSTVLPGAVRHALIPALEARAGAAGPGTRVCYSPAFIALGSVIRDFLHPDFLLIGERTLESGEVLQRAYEEILPGRPPVRRMSLENAELTKIAVNTFVTTKISFANMLAALCERIPGGDVDVVSNALGMDRRIGRAYLTGALGYGGPCFPRDNQALGFLARALDVRASIPEATDAVNRGLPDQIAERFSKRIRPGDVVGVLGLAYKPQTAVVEQSQSVEIARALLRRGIRVVAHDPLANETARGVLGREVEFATDVQHVLNVADVVLITTGDAAYASLKARDFTRSGRRMLVVDFWRCVRSELESSDGVDYIAVGVGDAGAVADRLRQLWADSAVAEDKLTAVSTGTGPTAAAAENPRSAATR